MEKPYQVISMADDDRIGDGGVLHRFVNVQFKVGTLGPFRLLIPKTENWELAMKTAIDNEVRRVNAIAS